jgi:[Skp1-protein]-hydroxyproline N-acetylglucosaminyltransferase
MHQSLLKFCQQNDNTAIVDGMAPLSRKTQTGRLYLHSNESMIDILRRRLRKPGSLGSNLVLPAFFVLAFLYITFALVALTMIPPLSQQPSFLSGGGSGRLLRSLRRKEEFVVDPAIFELTHKFPVHVNGDTEEIDHPGIAFSGSERIKALLPGFDFPQKLTVPKFWNPPEYGEAGVRTFLGMNGQRLMTPAEAQSVGSVQDGKDTIFLSVASYRDSECLPTVESLFMRAKHPERIRVAIVDQIEPEDPKCSEPLVPCGQDPEQVMCKYRHLIDVHEVRSYLMVGPVLARHMAHRMYRGEYFAMQVDAHVRFTESWDEDIISQWTAADNEMTVLSTYLTDIAGSIDPVTHASLKEDRNMMCVIKYDGAENQSRLVLKAPSKSIPQTKGTPMLHPFWSAGFSFARGHFVVQVPYDQHLPMVFQGEESSIAIRAFTYGYDFYAPERSVTFHIFAIKENISRRQRHKFWENDTLYSGALDKSLARLTGMTGMAGEKKTEYHHVDEKKYGLGHVRDKDKYYRTFGIHPKTRTVEGHLCNFVQESMHRQFTPYLRADGMGVDYNQINFEYKDKLAPDANE